MPSHLRFMRNIEFIEVVNQELIRVVEALANKIWHEHYTSIIGKKQVCYMLDKFQSQAAITQQIKDGFLYFLMKEEKDAYIGYIGVVQKDKKMFLSKIYLASEKRGKGHGRQAIHFIEQLAKEKGCLKISLTVNKNNINTLKVYERCGFVNVGPVVQDIGNGFIMDDYKLEKVI